MQSGLWLIILESAAALGLLVFIVWWTLPAKKKSERDGDGSADGNPKDG